MKFTYTEKEDVQKEVEISQGDIIVVDGGFQNKPEEYKEVRILAVVGDAILTEYPLNSCWSNKVYSAQQIMNYAKRIIPALQTKSN